MMTLNDLAKLPEDIKREVLQYAEYLAEKSRIDRTDERAQWADVSGRGASIGESAAETVARMRREERC